MSVLFNANENHEERAHTEIETALKKRQANDEVFIIDKSGNKIWCAGEALLVNSNDGRQYIVKDIISLQARKQVNLFLNGTEELLERVFDASKDIPTMILNGSMKIKKVNNAFIEFFKVNKVPEENSSLSVLDNEFWSSREIKNELSRVIVTNNPIKRKVFTYSNSENEQKSILLGSSVIHARPGADRKIFIIVEDVTNHD